MTVTSYNATFAATKGQKFHGTIFWDKYHTRRLTAQICPHISEHEVDYPVWTATATNNREGFEALVEKMKGRAKRMKLQVIAATENKFAPKASAVGQP